MASLVSFGVLAPPTIFIVLSLVGALLALVWRRSGIGLALASSLFLYVAATPAASSYLLQRVESALPQNVDLSGAQAIVVLGGDVRGGDGDTPDGRACQPGCADEGGARTGFRGSGRLERGPVAYDLGKRALYRAAAAAGEAHHGRPRQPRLALAARDMGVRAGRAEGAAVAGAAHRSAARQGRRFPAEHQRAA